MPYYGLFIHCLPLIIVVAVSVAPMQHSNRLQPQIKAICFTKSHLFVSLSSIYYINLCLNIPPVQHHKTTLCEMMELLETNFFEVFDGKKKKVKKAHMFTSHFFSQVWSLAGAHPILFLNLNSKSSFKSLTMEIIIFSWNPLDPGHQNCAVCL